MNSNFPVADALWSAILHRRSLGLARLKPDEVPPALVEQMLEAANWAPSHGETEPWRFCVFTGPGRETLAQIWAKVMADSEQARQRAFAAPVWISIGMAPRRKTDGSPLMPLKEELMAVACAMQNLHLMGCALGLAGMWHSKGPSVHPEVARELGLQSPDRLLGFFSCGWPAIDWPQGTRRPLDEKVRWVES